MNHVIKKGVKILIVLIFLAIFTRVFTWFVVTTEDSIVERNAYGTIVGAEPVYENGCDTAVLLLHGLGSSPSDFWQLYPLLDKKGLTVSAPLLEGHGTSPKDLSRTNHEAWLLNAEGEYAKLKNKDVIVVGNSMGSLLALELASKHDLKKVVLINPPLKLKSKFVDFLPIFWLFESYHPKDIFSVRDDNLPSFAVTYKVFPLKSISELLTLQEEVTGKLSEVDDPMIIFQSEKDNLVNSESTRIITERVTSQDKKVRFLLNSTHTYFSEEDLEIVKAEIDSLLVC